MEGLGELCAGFEVVPYSVLMWRDWVSSVLGLVVPDCVLIRREELGELCAGIEFGPYYIDVEGGGRSGGRVFL